MIKLALLDFGGVFTPSPYAVPAEAMAEWPVPLDVALQLLLGPYDTDSDHPWHQLERGEIPLQDAWQAIQAHAVAAGHEGYDPLSFLKHMGAADDAHRQVVIDAVRGVKARGVRTCLVTNNVAEFRDGWRSMVPADELFDDVVDSSEVKMRKPNPAIFHLALSRNGCEASEAVFLDDTPGHVRVAESLGIHGIVVGADRSAAMADLDALLARVGVAPH